MQWILQGVDVYQGSTCRVASVKVSGTGPGNIRYGRSLGVCKSNFISFLGKGLKKSLKRSVYSFVNISVVYGYHISNETHLASTQYGTLDCCLGGYTILCTSNDNLYVCNDISTLL